jgi:hypothetical protein
MSTQAPAAQQQLSEAAVTLLSQFPPRQAEPPWEATGQPREAVLQRLLTPPFVLSAESSQSKRRVGLRKVLAWLGGRPSKPESGNGLVLRVTHHKYAAPLIVSTAGTVKSLAGGDSFVSTVPARTCPTAASRRGGYCYGEWEPFPGRPRGARTDRRIGMPTEAVGIWEPERAD